MPGSEPSILRVHVDIVATCSSLLEIGYYTRGAVTVGLVHHQDNVVFGPALIRAHYLEQHVAIYPRIVVDDIAVPLLTRYEDGGDVEEGFNKESVLRVDQDGISYVSIMTLPVSHPMVLESHKAKIKQCLDIVEGKCKEHAKDVWLLMKDRWMRRYLESL